MKAPSLTPETLADLTALRHALHAAPDLSGEERATAARLRAFLAPGAPDRIVEGLGGTGLAVVYDSGRPGPRVLFRAELDALPIQEQTGLPYASRHSGKAHLCGHDGHMTILAGLGLHFAQHRPSCGQVILLFQPAEETGAGARAVLADPRFAELSPDWAFALHIMPGLPHGAVAVAAGAASCATCGLRIRLRGRETHAAHPEAGRSSAPAVAAILAGLTPYGTPPPMGPDFTLATPCHLMMGEAAFGIAPATAEIWITLRAYDDPGLARFEAAIRAQITEAAQGLTLEITRHDHFNASINDPSAAEHALQARDALGLAPGDMALPMRAGEDFGAFSTNTRAALIFVGAGEAHPALHRPDFDFPDTLLAPGIALFAQIADQISAEIGRSG